MNEKMSFDIVEFLLGPAEILTQGLIGLIMGIGMMALQIWLIFEIVVTVPPRAKNLVDAIDMELGQNNFSSTRYRIYTGIFQLFLPLVMVCACYMSFCLLTDYVMMLF